MAAKSKLFGSSAFTEDSESGKFIMTLTSNE